MNKIIISADSTCDISEEVRARYNLEILPLYVILGDDSYLDGVTANPEMLYAYVEEHRRLPKTAAATIVDYQEYFTSWTEKGYDVVHFTISSQMSTTYHNACLAAEEVQGNVYVIDSANLSTGTALLMLDASDMRAAGSSAAEIAEEMKRRAPLVRTSFVVDQLDYLRMGGRCSAVAALGANLLKLHPRIFVADGKMGVGEKYRGAIDGVMVQYVKQMLEQYAGKIVPNRCFVTHTKCRPETVSLIVNTVKEAGVFDVVFDTTAGCAVTTHCGPGTLGILFEVTE